ncbi:MAG: hypothetical protein R3Y28_00375 [Candidatus Gastranaerophilales bacterium]
MKLTNKLEDLQTYSTNIADGTISTSDMMNTPASMFNRQMMYMTYSHNGSIMGAQQKYTMMQPQIQMQMQQIDPNAQAQYQQWVFQNLYQQERERMAQMETKLLNEQEKEIQKEKAQIETRLKLLDQEYQSCKDAESAAIEQWKPVYTA